MKKKMSLRKYDKVQKTEKKKFLLFFTLRFILTVVFVLSHFYCYSAFVFIAVSTFMTHLFCENQLEWAYEKLLRFLPLHDDMVGVTL